MIAVEGKSPGEVIIEGHRGGRYDPDVNPMGDSNMYE